MTQSSPPANSDEQSDSADAPPTDEAPADATETKHPVGEEQARRNAEDELPG